MKKIKRLGLGTHFAGAGLLETTTEKFRSILVEDIIECLGDVVSPLPFTNGVYLISKECYVVLDGKTYNYPSGKTMFPYYLNDVNNNEIASRLTTQEKETLIRMKKHSLVTPKQLKVIEAIEDNQEKRKSKLRFHKRHQTP